MRLLRRARDRAVLNVEPPAPPHLPFLYLDTDSNGVSALLCGNCSFKICEKWRGSVQEMAAKLAADGLADASVAQASRQPLGFHNQHGPAGYCERQPGRLCTMSRRDTKWHS